MTVTLTALVFAVVILGLVGLSAFFSSSETAIFSLSEAQIEEVVATGDARAAVLADLRRDPHRLLVTILVGNNVVNVTIASLVTAAVGAVLSTGWAVVAATVAASVLILVFGEIVPKAYGLGNATRWSLAVARPLEVIEWVGGPVVHLFDGVTSWITARLGGEPHIEQPYLDE